MEINRFIRDHEPAWQELERRLNSLGEGGLAALARADVRRLVALYRQASSDLIEARARMPNAELLSYLNGLVARAYAEVYASRGVEVRRWSRFVRDGFPRLLRRRRAYVLTSSAVFLAGVLVGFLACVLDPQAREWLVPADHQMIDPRQRVARLESGGDEIGALQAASFSSFLFTHNIKVAFFAFALGITAGVLTIALLFMNGVSLGALAADYHLCGVGEFFWAWILPHGVPEIGSILVAGGAGLLLGRSLLHPAEGSRRRSFARDGTEALYLMLGTIPFFIGAGLVEGSLSQIHEPLLPYPLKLTFALVEAVLIALYLRRGREPIGAGADGEAGATAAARPRPQMARRAFIAR